MKKATFLEYDKPLLTAMVQEETPEEAICVIMDALYDGAEAFGIQLCNLAPEYRNEKSLRKIFAACEGKPIYITSYRLHNSINMTDEERADLLLLGLRSGATLCDVMGDYFCPEANQLTFSKEAVNKQKELIKKIHELGGEVLMSTHLSEHFDEDRVMEYAHSQIERGADVVKIVNISNNDDEQIESFNVIHRMKKELKHPFLYLVGGTHTRLIRQIGPALGVCMYLCVNRYKPVTAKAQPILRYTKEIRDNMFL